MTHMKRLASTKRIPIERKGTKYLTVQSPGPHSKADSVALSIVLRDILKLVDTSREVKNLLNTKKILINGDVRTNHKFPIGFLDIISFADIKDKYIVTYSTLGKLEFKKLEKEHPRAVKIIGKKIIGKGKTQINLFTGKNILSDKSKEYSVGDSLILEKGKITKHLKFEKGAKVFLTSGKYIGHNGSIEEIKKHVNWSQPKMILVKTKDGVFETPKDYAYVIDGEI